MDVSAGKLITFLAIPKHPDHPHTFPSPVFAGDMSYTRVVKALRYPQQVLVVWYSFIPTDIPSVLCYVRCPVRNKEYKHLNQLEPANVTLISLTN